MSYLDEALNRLEEQADQRSGATLPFVAEVAGIDGVLTTIRRKGATVADAEPYPKATGDTFAIGDQVLIQPVITGKPVIIGKIRR